MSGPSRIRSALSSWLVCGTALLCGVVTQPAWGEEHVIRMLNTGENGSMVFEPAFVRARVGDNLRFEPVNTGHFVRSLAVPAGSAPWQSPMDQAFEVRLEREGLYFYNCPPHLMMGMVGLVQVDEAGNRSAVVEIMRSTKSRVYSGGARIDALMGQIQ